MTSLELPKKQFIRFVKLTDWLREDFQFYNELGLKYPESEIVYKTESGMKRFNFISTLLRKMHGKLLDVGCNNYQYESSWQDDYVGVDIAITLLKMNQCNGIQATVYNLPFQNQMFDVVLLTEVLEHLPEREYILKEIYRVLKDHGQLIISVPTGGEDSEPFSPVWFPDPEKYGLTPHRYLHGFFSKSQLRKLCSENNFHVQSLIVLKSEDCDHLVIVTQKGESQSYYLKR